jgi:hypothetical protein
MKARKEMKLKSKERKRKKVGSKVGIGRSIPPLPLLQPPPRQSQPGK